MPPHGRSSSSAHGGAGGGANNIITLGDDPETTRRITEILTRKVWPHTRPFEPPQCAEIEAPRTYDAVYDYLSFEIPLEMYARTPLMIPSEFVYAILIGVVSFLGNNLFTFPFELVVNPGMNPSIQRDGQDMCVIVIEPLLETLQPGGHIGPIGTETLADWIHRAATFDVDGHSNLVGYRFVLLALHPDYTFSDALRTGLIMAELRTQFGTDVVVRGYADILETKKRAIMAKLAKETNDMIGECKKEIAKIQKGGGARRRGGGGGRGRGARGRQRGRPANDDDDPDAPADEEDDDIDDDEIDAAVNEPDPAERIAELTQRIEDLREEGKHMANAAVRELESCGVTRHQAASVTIRTALQGRIGFTIGANITNNQFLSGSFAYLQLHSYREWASYLLMLFTVPPISCLETMAVHQSMPRSDVDLIRGWYLDKVKTVPALTKYLCGKTFPLLGYNTALRWLIAQILEAHCIEYVTAVRRILNGDVEERMADMALGDNNGDNIPHPPPAPEAAQEGSIEEMIALRYYDMVQLTKLLGPELHAALVQNVQNVFKASLPDISLFTDDAGINDDYVHSHSAGATVKVAMAALAPHMWFKWGCTMTHSMYNRIAHDQRHASTYFSLNDEHPNLYVFAPPPHIPLFRLAHSEMIVRPETLSILRPDVRHYQFLELLKALKNERARNLISSGASPTLNTGAHASTSNHMSGNVDDETEHFRPHGSREVGIDPRNDPQMNNSVLNIISDMERDSVELDDMPHTQLRVIPQRLPAPTATSSSSSSSSSSSVLFSSSSSSRVPLLAGSASNDSYLNQSSARKRSAPASSSSDLGQIGARFGFDLDDTIPGMVRSQSCGGMVEICNNARDHAALKRIQNATMENMLYLKCIRRSKRAGMWLAQYIKDARQFVGHRDYVKLMTFYNLFADCSLASLFSEAALNTRLQYDALVWLTANRDQMPAFSLVHARPPRESGEKHTSLMIEYEARARHRRALAARAEAAARKAAEDKRREEEAARAREAELDEFDADAMAAAAQRRARIAAGETDDSSSDSEDGIGEFQPAQPMDHDGTQQHPNDDDSDFSDDEYDEDDVDAVCARNLRRNLGQPQPPPQPTQPEAPEAPAAADEDDAMGLDDPAVHIDEDIEAGKPPPYDAAGVLMAHEFDLLKRGWNLNAQVSQRVHYYLTVPRSAVNSQKFMLHTFNVGPRGSGKSDATEILIMCSHEDSVMMVGGMSKNANTDISREFSIMRIYDEMSRAGEINPNARNTSQDDREYLEKAKAEKSSGVVVHNRSRMGVCTLTIAHAHGDLDVMNANRIMTGDAAFIDRYMLLATDHMFSTHEESNVNKAIYKQQGERNLSNPLVAEAVAWFKTTQSLQTLAWMAIDTQRMPDTVCVALRMMLRSLGEHGMYIGNAVQRLRDLLRVIHVGIVLAIEKAYAIHILLDSSLFATERRPIVPSDIMRIAPSMYVDLSTMRRAFSLATPVNHVAWFMLAALAMRFGRWRLFSDTHNVFRNVFCRLDPIRRDKIIDGRLYSVETGEYPQYARNDVLREYQLHRPAFYPEDWNGRSLADMPDDWKSYEEKVHVLRSHAMRGPGFAAMQTREALALNLPESDDNILIPAFEQTTEGRVRNAANNNGGGDNGGGGGGTVTINPNRLAIRVEGVIRTAGKILECFNVSTERLKLCWQDMTNNSSITVPELQSIQVDGKARLTNADIISQIRPCMEVLTDEHGTKVTRCKMHTIPIAELDSTNNVFFISTSYLLFAQAHNQMMDVNCMWECAHTPVQYVPLPITWGGNTPYGIIKTKPRAGVVPMMPNPFHASADMVPTTKTTTLADRRRIVAESEGPETRDEMGNVVDGGSSILNDAAGVARSSSDLDTATGLGRVRPEIVSYVERQTRDTSEFAEREQDGMPLANPMRRYFPALKPNPALWEFQVPPEHPREYMFHSSKRNVVFTMPMDVAFYYMHLTLAGLDPRINTVYEGFPGLVEFANKSTRYDPRLLWSWPYYVAYRDADVESLRAFRKAMGGDVYIGESVLSSRKRPEHSPEYDHAADTGVRGHIVHRADLRAGRNQPPNAPRAFREINLAQTAPPTAAQPQQPQTGNRYTQPGPRAGVPSPRAASAAAAAASTQPQPPTPTPRGTVVAPILANRPPPPVDPARGRSSGVTPLRRPNPNLGTQFWDKGTTTRPTESVSSSSASTLSSPFSSLQLSGPRRT